MTGLTLSHDRFVEDMADPPFACPPDIVLDLPVPPSVNRTRRLNAAYGKQYRGWTDQADRMVLAARCRSVNPIKNLKIPGPFEAIIILSEHHTGIDLDNGIKAIIDYARRIELIVDDGPKYLRRLTVEWGSAPMGCRLTLRGMAI